MSTKNFKISDTITHILKKPLTKRENINVVSNKLDVLFELKNKNLLNIFCTAGFPDKDSTAEVMIALQKHGADMIEIGMPYSDPIADGPVIQQSNLVALKNGMTMELLFRQLNEIKKQLTVPVILMGYLNPVLQYGMDRFCADAANAGVDAVILPDLPMYEFETYYKKIFEKNNLHVVFLITPETSEQRIKMADKLSSGFLYAVSSSTTTGNTEGISSNEKYFKKLAAMKLKNPYLIGFGINDRDGFENACSYASGAIIGSAYIKALMNNSGNTDQTTALFIRGIKPVIE